jgi:hypothetical protein
LGRSTFEVDLAYAADLGAEFMGRFLERSRVRAADSLRTALRRLRDSESSGFIQWNPRAAALLPIRFWVIGKESDCGH